MCLSMIFPMRYLWFFCGVKYDKIVADNLLIPGIIGTSCQFPNLREFLLNKKEEISNNIFETKKNSREIKENKNKMDGLFEQLKFQIIRKFVKRIYFNNK